MGKIEIKADSVDTSKVKFETTATEASVPGQLNWNQAEGTLDLGLAPNVVLQLGKETLQLIYNSTGSSLIPGQVVFPQGVEAGKLTVNLATTDAFAVVTETILDATQGYVCTTGLVEKLNTSTLTAGAPVWLSPTVAGGLTSTKPTLSDTAIRIGFCVTSDSSLGSIFVNIKAEQTGSTAEYSRAVAAETSLASAISFEISRATSIESSLAQSILEEYSRSSSVETSLAQSISEKVTSNTAITPGTATKITYDGKGLVTEGASASLDDLSDAAILNPIVDQILKWNGTNWVNASGAVVNAGPGVTFFLSSTAGINGYDVMSKTPDSASEVDESVTVHDNTLLLDSYIADTQINKTSIDAGIWEFNYFAYVGNTHAATLLTEVYRRTTLGTETLLFSVVSPAISSNIPDLVTAQTVQQAFACNTTDKLIIKIYGQTTVNSNVTVHLVHSGTQYYSHFHTPLVVSHNDISGLQGGATGQYYHVTSAQSSLVQGLQSLSGNKALVTNPEGAVSTSLVSDTEIGYLSGVTSNIQTQLTNKEPTITTLPVSKGGTGSSSFTAGSLLFSNGVSLTQDNSNLYFDDFNNTLGIGTNSPNANSILDLSSISKALLPPRMTTTQKSAIASPVAGMVVYDTDLLSLSTYNGTAWETKVKSLKITGDSTPLVGNVELESGTNINLTRAGQRLKISTVSSGVTSIEDGGSLSGTYTGDVLCLGSASVTGITVVNGSLFVIGNLTNTGGYKFDVLGDLHIIGKLDFRPTGSSSGDLTIQGDCNIKGEYPPISTAISTTFTANGLGRQYDLGAGSPDTDTALSATQKIGYYFSMVNPFRITSVVLQGSAPSASIYATDLITGLPTGSALATSNSSGVFTSPITLAANTQYAVVLNGPTFVSLDYSGDGSDGPYYDGTAWTTTISAFGNNSLSEFNLTVYDTSGLYSSSAGSAENAGINNQISTALGDTDTYRRTASITFTSGANSGQTRIATYQNDGQLYNINSPLPFLPLTTDTFTYTAISDVDEAIVLRSLTAKMRMFVNGNLHVRGKIKGKPHTSSSAGCNGADLTVSGSLYSQSKLNFSALNNLNSINLSGLGNTTSNFSQVGFSGNLVVKGSVYGCSDIHTDGGSTATSFYAGNAGNINIGGNLVAPTTGNAVAGSITAMGGVNTSSSGSGGRGGDIIIGGSIISISNSIINLLKVTGGDATISSFSGGFSGNITIYGDCILPGAQIYIKSGDGHTASSAGNLTIFGRCLVNSIYGAGGNVRAGFTNAGDASSITLYGVSTIDTVTLVGGSGSLSTNTYLAGSGGFFNCYGYLTLQTLSSTSGSGVSGQAGRPGTIALIGYGKIATINCVVGGGQPILSSATQMSINGTWLLGSVTTPANNYVISYAQGLWNQTLLRVGSLTGRTTFTGANGTTATQATLCASRLYTYNSTTGKWQFTSMADA